MNRYLLALSLICLLSNNAIPSTSESENVKKWKRLKEDIDSQKNSTVVDKNEVMRKYEEDFDDLLNTKYNFGLTEQQCNAAFILKCACRNNMEKRLNEKFYTDEHAVKKDAKKQVKSCIAEIARSKTEYICQRLNLDRETQKKLGQEEYEKALSEARKFWGGDLSYLIDGTLEKNLRKKTDSLLRAKKEIYEIYPHENSPRREETLTKIRNEGHFRDEICSACRDSYEDIGKRVNFPCGHDMCPNCFYQNKYIAKRHECPKCRKHIYNDDFPVDYLQRHIP